MPRSRPNRRDYVTVQLNRMLGKKDKPKTLILDDPIQDEPSTQDKTTDQLPLGEKTFRTPSIPSASVANQPDIWRRRDNNPLPDLKNETSNSSKGKRQFLLDATSSISTQDNSFPSIQVQEPESQNQQMSPERVQYNSSR